MSQKLLGGMVAKEAYSSAPVMADRLEEEDASERFKKPLSKLDSTLLVMVEKQEKGKTFSADESARLQNGKVMVQVWLTESTAETLEQIKKLGFKLVTQPKSSHLLIGYIPIEQLEDLAKLSVVRYVTLQPLPA